LLASKRFSSVNLKALITGKGVMPMIQTINTSMSLLQKLKSRMSEAFSLDCPSIRVCGYERHSYFAAAISRPSVHRTESFSPAPTLFRTSNEILFLPCLLYTHGLQPPRH
jgi:hypothetical protein